MLQNNRSNKNSNNKIENITGSVNTGDDYITNIYNNQDITGFRKKVLDALSCESEVEDYIKSLKKYMNSKSEDQTIGLENKIKKAGSNYEFLLEDALELKEKFLLDLHDNYYSLAYQKLIYAMIDEAIYKFKYSVLPLIIESKEISIVLGKLTSDVFDPIFKDISDISNYNFDRSFVEGLIYFLTGNCYLKWYK